MLRKIVIFVGLCVLLFLATVYWSYSDAVFRVPVEEKVVALTFDDGPNPPHTRALLALLQEHRVKATFFLKGSHVEAFPMETREVAWTGHEVANHSYSHRPMLSLSVEDMREEITRTNALIEGHLDYAPVLFRPPYGLQGPGVKRALDELDMTSVLMTDHGADWEVDDPRQIADAVLAGVEPGAIILLHDGHGDVDDPHSQHSREPTVVATGMIIESLKSQGYRFVTVGQLLAKDK